MKINPVEVYGIRYHFKDFNPATESMEDPEYWILVKKLRYLINFRCCPNFQILQLFTTLEYLTQVI